MKNKHLFSCLFLVFSLTACGGSSDNGIIANGTPYRAGELEEVDPSIVAQKEGSIATITETTKSVTKVTLSSGGRKNSYSADTTTTTILDYVNETVEFRGKVNAQTGLSNTPTNISVKIKRNNYDDYQIISEKNFVSYLSGAGISQYSYFNSLFSQFDLYEDMLFSWNFIPNFENVASLAGSGDGYYDDSLDYDSSLDGNILVAGTPSNGNFDIGIGRAITIGIYDDEEVSITKYKASFKNYLMKSMVEGIKIKVNNGGVYDGAGMQTGQMTAEMSSNVNFSYTYKNGGGQKTPFNI